MTFADRGDQEAIEFAPDTRGQRGVYHFRQLIVFDAKAGRRVAAALVLGMK